MARFFHLTSPLLHAENTIHYTITDEAPQLATYALLPVLRRFTSPYGIKLESPNISLASRIIAQFSSRLKPEQKEPDYLAMLADLTQDTHGNIIKLPNISASVPQLLEAIAELQAKGFDVPEYPQDPKTEEEKAIAAAYAKVLGSAVNPVLREGNSDRRVALPVKKNAQRSRPPVRMRPWPPVSKTHVAHMKSGDFFGSEKSYVVPKDTKIQITHVDAQGKKTVLKSGLAVIENEILDASVMNARELRAFFEEQLQDAKAQDVMVSLHLKATMMKVSDPIIFGHAVSVYFKDVFAKHGDTLRRIGVNPNMGLASVLAKLSTLEDAALRSQIEADIEAAYAARPRLAMVDSSKGITNLHVPNDVIIDASMPPLIRDGGMMWNKDDDLEDTKALIPDRSYALAYQAIIDDCKKHGQFDHATMGSVSNVGLMAQKAEEYGSHDKTFEIAADGEVVVTDDSGAEVFRHKVEKGDIWRMCQTKDIAVRDWVKLAVSRVRATGVPAIFWLDSRRAHDAVLIAKVKEYIAAYDTTGMDISILPPSEAMTATCQRARAGKDTISVTGNVLRDYLTDLFPILELGTSAKMLSIVPLLAGGGLFETGAGGSAPKHVQQFLKEGHLRWDSLGEYLAMAVSLEHLATVAANDKAKLLCDTLNAAVGKVLDNNKSPSRKVREIDNRGTTFYVALYWAQALAEHDSQFRELAKKLADNEETIMKDMLACQGVSVDVGGYYKPDDALAVAAMRPSRVFNDIIDSL